jgi:IMP dehydrogenase
MDLGQSYCFDDVLMEPLYSNIISRSHISLDSNIGTNGRNLILKTPLISSPMDTVTEKDMAIKMALCGGLGIIHRFMDIEEQVSHVTKVKRFLQYVITEPYTVTMDTTLDQIEKMSSLYNVFSFCIVDPNTNKFQGLITHRDLEYMQFKRNQNSYIDGGINKPCKVSDFITDKYYITLESSILESLDNTIKVAKSLMLQNKIEKIPIITINGILSGLITLKNIRHYENNKSKACIDANGALCVGAAIGIVGDYLERLDALVNAGADLICVDVANGFNENVINAIRIIRSKYPKTVLMAGNVCNWQGYEALCSVGLDIDCIRVGVGNGSICTTRLETGIGKGQFSAVSECFRYKVMHSNGDGNLYKPNIICDGGSLGKTGNKVKALACGASAIILGRTLASTEESPGQVIYRNGKRFKYIRGMASTMANLSKQEKTEGSKKLKTNFTSEGVDGEQELSGSVSDLIEQLNGGIKSGLSYLGCKDIAEVHAKSARNEIKFNLVTSIGMTETGIRVKTY